MLHRQYLPRTIVLVDNSMEDDLLVPLDVFLRTANNSVILNHKSIPALKNARLLKHRGLVLLGTLVLWYHGWL